MRGMEGGEGNSGIVMVYFCEDGMRNIAGRLVLMLMRAGILVWWTGSGGGGSDGSSGSWGGVFF